MNSIITEEAIWEWLGWKPINTTLEGGDYCWRSPDGNEWRNLPDIRSLDVQDKHLWPKLNFVITTEEAGEGCFYAVALFNADIKIASGKHKDFATAVLLAVMELVK